VKPFDIDDAKRLRRMGRKMTALYDVLDPALKKATEGMSISCKSGCAGCCYLLALVSLPEAVAIAEHFLSDTGRRQLVPLLMRSFFEQAQAIPPGPFKTIRESYFAKKVPCTFLDTESKLCTIYSVRPSACRYHFVVSDPALCQPEAGNQEVARVNTLQADAHVLSEANRVSNQTKIPLFVAPLPVTMLWAFKLLIEGREAFDLALKDDTLGVLALSGWTELLRADESAPHQEARPEVPAEGTR
jgi:Fe-S-cluster containining protein